MDYYCDVCEKTTKTKSKIKHFQSVLQNELEQGIRRNFTIKSPDFFDIDEVFNDILLIIIKKSIYISWNVTLNFF